MRVLPPPRPQPKPQEKPAKSLISAGFSFVQKLRRKVSTAALPAGREKEL